VIWAIANWRIMLLAGASALSFAGGVYLQTLRWDAAEAKAMQAIEEKRKTEAAIAADTEMKLAKIEAENRTLKGKLLNETHKPDYRCKLPAPGLQLLQDARTGQSSKPDGKMP